MARVWGGLTSQDDASSKDDMSLMNLERRPVGVFSGLEVVADLLLHMPGWQSLFAEACGGYAAGAATDAVFYLLDSYKTQRQMNQALDWRKMSNGLVTLSLIGTG